MIYNEKLIAVIAAVCAMLLSVFNISSKTLCVHTAYVLLILIYGNIWSLKKNSISQKAIVYVWHLYISKGISNFIQNYYCTEESCIVYSIILDDFRFRKIYGLKYETHFIQTYLVYFTDPESLPLQKLWHGIFPTQSRKKELQCAVINSLIWSETFIGVLFAMFQHWNLHKNLIGDGTIISFNVWLEPFMPSVKKWWCNMVPC